MIMIIIITTIRLQYITRSLHTHKRFRTMCNHCYDFFQIRLDYIQQISVLEECEKRELKWSDQEAEVILEGLLATMDEKHV